jgi:hypothetical protein
MRKSARNLEKLVAVAFVVIAIASLVGNYINTTNQIQVNNILSVKHPEINNIGVMIKGVITGLEDLVLLIIAGVLYFDIKPWGK